jgi:hypothetical protein
MKSELRYAAAVAGMLGVIGEWETRVAAGEDLDTEDMESEVGGVAAVHGIDAWLSEEGVVLERDGKTEVLKLNFEHLGWGGMRSSVDDGEMHGGDGDSGDEVEDDSVEILDDSDYTERWM